jgi:chitodextrinase
MKFVAFLGSHSKLARPVVAAILVLSSTCSASTPPPVPPFYQGMYTSLDTVLTTFNTTLSLLGNGSKYPVKFAIALKSADSNAGPQLVSSGASVAVQRQLQELKAMGVQAVMVQVGFPMLYEPFLTSQGQSYSQFVTFYQQVAADVRAAGLKLVVENNILLANDAQSGWTVAPFYATLNWTQYQQARAHTAAVIAHTMQPDYLVVLQEPDTEAGNTGQSDVNTASGAAALVSQMLTSIQQAGVPNLKVGAGVGTWLKGYLDFIQDFDALPLDFIDMHIYPVFAAAFLPNALTIATTAAAAGKPVSISECWLNKSDDAKSTPSEVRARNPFSFWAPLDAYFIQTMQNLANYTQMEFMSMTGAEYFAAYLPYNSANANLTPSEILSQEETQASLNMVTGTYTYTGMSYYHSMVSPPDVIPPSVPSNLAGVSGNSTTASLSWNGATDNVGVAAYSVMRDGVQVGTTVDTFFQDFGLTQGTTYNYKIQAFDLAGNASPFTASVPVTTREVTPPTIPTHLVATVVSKVEIDLAWSPSTDNIGIRLYRVFQGPSPTALSQVANTQGTVTSYHAYHLTAGTTYYFGVEAEDNNGNISQKSKIVTATTQH